MRCVLALAALVSLSSCSKLEDALRPRDDAERVRRINATYEAGDAKTAEGEIDAYLGKYPRSSQGYRLKGWIEFTLEHDAAAQQAFDKALELNRREDNAHVGLGALARRQDKLDLARREYEKAIQIEPKNPEALASLVVIELKAKNYPKAVEVGERARALDATNPVVLANLCVAYHYLGDTKKRDQLFALAKQNGYASADRLEKLFKGTSNL